MFTMTIARVMLGVILTVMIATNVAFLDRAFAFKAHYGNAGLATIVSPATSEPKSTVLSPVTLFNSPLISIPTLGVLLLMTVKLAKSVVGDMKRSQHIQEQNAKDIGTLAITVAALAGTDKSQAVQMSAIMEAQKYIGEQVSSLAKSQKEYADKMDQRWEKFFDRHEESR